MTTVRMGETYACLAEPGMVVVVDGWRFEVAEVERVVKRDGSAGFVLGFAEDPVTGGGPFRALFDAYAVLAFER